MALQRAFTTPDTKPLIFNIGCFVIIIIIIIIIIVVVVVVVVIINIIISWSVEVLDIQLFIVPYS